MEDLFSFIEMRIPRTMVGINASAQVGGIAREIGVKRALIVTDKLIVQAGLIAGIKGSLQEQNVTAEVFADCPVSAPVSSIIECSKAIVAQKSEVVIGVGGGSVLDLTKLAVVLAAHDIDTRILFDASKMKRRGLPMMLLPTTAGTGSEVSSAAVFMDEAQIRKVSVKSEYLWADVVVLDPKLTLNLPRGITADTGMDALSHAIEAYTSVKANAIADTFAEKTIKLVAENLRVAYAKGDTHIDARYNMMLAASFGILAIRSSASYIVHSLAIPWV